VHQESKVLKHRWLFFKNKRIEQKKKLSPNLMTKEGKFNLAYLWHRNRSKQDAKELRKKIKKRNRSQRK